MRDNAMKKETEIHGVKHDASAVLGACEFHKKTGITEQMRRLEGTFRKQFVNARTGRIKRRYVRKRTCPLCNGKEFFVIFVKNGFPHVRCECGMIYVPEILKDEYANIVYADQSYEEETHRSFRTEPRKSFIEAIYVDGMSLLNKAGIRSGRLLDVGCSSGMFMEYAQKKGFSVKGVEPSEYAVNLARSMGLDVRKGYFEKSTPESELFDVVTLWDVLEHCDDPFEILGTAREALAPGGCIFLQVPNAMGLAPRIMQARCNMFTGFSHINLFGPDTLEAILGKCGFGNMTMQTVISEVSVLNNYLHYHDPYYGPSTEREKVLGLISLKDINENLLGYKLQIAAIKN
jgi:2-polyprenyl-3-methyl-5-hydroxy-6-metoxy-1,4-benzoquinol methylase